MADPNSLPTSLTTSYPTTSAGSVGYMMMSYPGRPPMVPMQPSVGMPYMPIGAAGPPIMPTIMPMPPMMAPATGMVSSTIQQPPFRNQRARKPNASSKAQLIVKPPSVTISAPSTINTLASQDIPKGPPVTVFVGNITDKAPDLMIRQILASCGHVMSWKRVQAFGFCEFGNPDAALRAHRLLHEMEIGSRKLVVRVDAKTQDVLDEYKAEKRKNMKSDDSKKDVPENEDYMDADMRTMDENVKKRIQDILQDYKDQMQKYNPPSGDDDKPKTGAEVTEARVQQTHQRLMQLTKSSTSSSNLNMKIDLDTVEYAEDGKRDLISREIGKFREIMKKQEEEKELERKKREEREKERERYRSPRSPSTNGRGRSQSYQSISSTRSITPESRSPRNRSRVRSRSRDRDRRNPDRSRERERDRDREHRDRERERDKDRDRERDRERERERDRDRDRDQHRDRDHDRERVRDRDRDNDRTDVDSRDRDRNRDRDRDRDHERSPRDRDERPDKDMVREKEEEEELKEQRKRERAAREREASYQERLKSWETREKYKSREAAKEKEKRRIKEEEKQKEAKRLKEFLEDYDDERDDAKYYKGRELQRKLADRELEIEMDNRDRQKEKEELEELKAKIYSSDSNNPEFEFAKLLKAREELYKPKLLIDVTEEQQRKEKQHEKEKEAEREKRRERDREREEWEREQQQQKRVDEQRRAAFADEDAATGEHLKNDAAQLAASSPSSSSWTRKESSAVTASTTEAADRGPDEDGDVDEGDKPMFNRSLSSSPAPMAVPSPDNYSTPPMPVPPPSHLPQSNDKLDDAADSNDNRKKKRKLDVKDVFNNDDDDSLQPKQKRKLVPIDYNDDKKLKESKSETPKSQEEKRKHIKTLIDKIPTDKASLFKYALDWSSVDNNLMEKRIRPWINKKIIEYIGEPEPTLVDFICSKVLAGSEPQSILDDVQMVLDEEAEVFVVKMWRLLIYEVEAKKLGLMK